MSDPMHPDTPAETWTDIHVVHAEPTATHLEVGIALIDVVTVDTVMVVAGDYPTEPDLVVAVTHAVDADGNDVRMRIAAQVVELLRGSGV